MNEKLIFQTDLNDAHGHGILSPGCLETCDIYSRTNWTRRIKEPGWRSTFLMSNIIVVLGVLSPLIQLIRPPFQGRKALLEFVPADIKDMKWMNRLKSLNQLGNSRCRFQVNVCRMLVLSIYAKYPTIIRNALRKYFQNSSRFNKPMHCACLHSAPQLSCLQVYMLQSLPTKSWLHPAVQ